MFLHLQDNYIVVHIQFGDHHNVTPLQSETSLSCALLCPALCHLIAPLMIVSSPAHAAYALLCLKSRYANFKINEYE